MKEILIGILIVLCCFIVIDFIYTEKNECIIEKAGYSEAKKCGILKEKADINLEIFGRYW